MRAGTGTRSGAAVVVVVVTPKVEGCRRRAAVVAMKMFHVGAAPGEAAIQVSKVGEKLTAGRRLGRECVREPSVCHRGGELKW